MPHERPPHPTKVTHQRPQRQEVKASVILAKMTKDIKALNSTVLLLSQKINYIVRNEKILSRNILVINKKVKDLERKSTGAESVVNDNEIEKLREILEQNTAQIEELYSSIERLKETTVKLEQFKEIKYIVDAINPLEFVTYKDIDRLIDEKLEEALKNKKQIKNEKI